MDLETNYDFSVRRQLVFLPASHHQNALYGPLPACNWVYEVLHIPKSTLAYWWQDCLHATVDQVIKIVYKDCVSV